MASVKKPPHKRAKHYLQEWRVFRGISQEKAAERVELSRPNLSKIENGDVPYEQDRLEQLAVLYNCSVADLISRDPFAEPDISIFDLPEGDRQRVRDFVRALSITRVTEEGAPATELPDTAKPALVKRRRAV